jgi:protein tyrosine kinase modulator
MAEAGLDASARRLAAAEAAYGPEHPDVKRARRDWQESLARRDEEAGRFRSERIREHLLRIDGEVRENEAALAAAHRDMAAFQKRVDASPRWGQELANLSRDHEMLRARYAAMVGRRADAAVSEALLAADQQTMFRVVDAPVTPVRPSAPDRARLTWLSVLAALAAGLTAAALGEWLDATVRGPEDAASLGVPVLAAIPRIGPRRAS